MSVSVKIDQSVINMSVDLFPGEQPNRHYIGNLILKFVPRGIDSPSTSVQILLTSKQDIRKIADALIELSYQEDIKE